ncbi:MAG: serine/threonine-protein kinase [Byssovorax sp.]
MSIGDPSEGDTIDNRYQLDRELGRGGHGIVFAAHDLSRNEPVAIKILRQNISEDPQYAVRLWREAEALRALWGQSVVTVHGFGNDADGWVYMVMELLEGETLDDYLFELEDFGDRMSVFETLRTLDPVARALHTAHSKGIIHRDLKPANIFRVSPEAGGGVRLMDFGLAKIAGSEQLTQAGMIAGSPSYIAPEIWRCEAFDHRVDIYSLAAVVFRCLAGRTPFVAPNPLELYMKVIKDERPRLSPLRPGLPPEVDLWVARSLALDKDQRYPYVSTMWNDLLRILMQGAGPTAEKIRATFRLPG